MERRTTITVHPDYRVAHIERELYGCFLEPIHNWVYGGIYNPDHPTADDMGFRGDMLEAIRALGIPAVRLPGGNFTSGWEWRDSIGPKAQRKRHLDFAWRQIETNAVGHDEYLEWTRRAGATPLYTLNCGTADINSNIECVEYTNFEGGTYWSDLRRQNGYEKPHKVPVWYLGNEMDGPWQINSWQRDPKGYGVRCLETGKALRWIDPSIRLGVCGASSPLLRSSPTWEREVLEQCYDIADYLSLHYYHGAPEGDFANLFAGSAVFETYLDTQLAVADYARALTNHPKKLMVSFDEYAMNWLVGPAAADFGRNGYVPHETYNEFHAETLARPYKTFGPDDMQPHRRVDPPILTALSLASVLLMLIRRADRVKIGCMTAAMGDAIGYDRDHVWKNPAYYPYSDLIRFGQGVSLLPAVRTPTFDAPGFHFTQFNEMAPQQNVPYVESAAALDEEAGALTVFVLNRDWQSDMPVELRVPGFKGLALESATQLFTDDLNAGNSYGSEVVHPVALDAKLSGENVTFTAKKLSWNVLRFKVK